LNNQGVVALKKENWHGAFDKFEDALKIDPSYAVARENLAIAHSNYALSLRTKNSVDSLKHFHQAGYLEPKNAFFSTELRAMIKLMGKNPDSFRDRVALGDQAKTDGDTVGAVVEYGAALKLKEDRQIHKKLGDEYRLLDDKNKAAAEYAAAYKDAD
jgi:lipoprotein NlpI